MAKSMRNSGFTMKSSTVGSSTMSPAKTSTVTSELYGVRQSAGEVIFTTLCPEAAIAEIAGEFNGWHPEKNPMWKISDNGVWQAKIRMAPGTYRYRLVIDGKWQQDPFNNHSEPNPYGELNSVVTVK